MSKNSFTKNFNSCVAGFPIASVAAHMVLHEGLGKDLLKIGVPIAALAGLYNYGDDMAQGIADWGKEHNDMNIGGWNVGQAAQNIGNKLNDWHTSGTRWFQDATPEWMNVGGQGAKDRRAYQALYNNNLANAGAIARNEYAELNRDRMASMSTDHPMTDEEFKQRQKGIGDRFNTMRAKAGELAYNDVSAAAQKHGGMQWQPTAADGYDPQQSTQAKGGATQQTLAAGGTNSGGSTPPAPPTGGKAGGGAPTAGSGGAPAPGSAGPATGTPAGQPPQGKPTDQASTLSQPVAPKPQPELASKPEGIKAPESQPDQPAAPEKAGVAPADVGKPNTPIARPGQPVFDNSRVGGGKDYSAGLAKGVNPEFLKPAGVREPAAQQGQQQAPAPVQAQAAQLPKAGTAPVDPSSGNSSPAAVPGQPAPNVAGSPQSGNVGLASGGALQQAERDNGVAKQNANNPAATGEGYIPPNMLPSNPETAKSIDQHRRNMALLNGANQAIRMFAANNAIRNYNPTPVRLPNGNPVKPEMLTGQGNAFRQNPVRK